jgi:hypothetical protein
LHRRAQAWRPARQDPQTQQDLGNADEDQDALPRGAAEPGHRLDDQQVPRGAAEQLAEQPVVEPD